MRSAIIGFVIGILWLQNQPVLPPPLLCGVLLAAAALLYLPIFRIRRGTVKFPLLLLCGVVLGIGWSALLAQQRLAQALPKALEGQDVTVVGTIDSLPYRFAQGVRFNLAVEQVLPRDGVAPQLPAKLALSWYSAFRAEELQAVGEVRPGERWQLTVRLQRPHGSANPMGFDYEVWLLEQGLRATGYVRPDAQSLLKNQRLTPFVYSFGNLVEHSRGWLRERIYAALPDRQYADVIVALVVGDQRGISQSDWKVFNRTGVGHLISISGLHITLVAGLFSWLASALWRRSFFTQAQLPLLLPAQKVAALTGALVALLYVLLAGFGVPAQRTLYMLSVVAAALWCGRLSSVSHVLCLALLAVLILDPWAVLWPGFWLSFGAVAMILYASVGRVQLQSDAELSRTARWGKALKSAAHTQYVVTLGLVPLTILLFGQTSAVSPLANAIAIPLVSFVVTPLALLGSVLPAPLSGWTLILAHGMVETLARGLRWMSELPGAVWLAPVPAAWMFGCALLGTLWLLAPSGWPCRWLGWFAWLPLVLNAPSRPAEGQMWVTAFDVGQGMAVLLETHGHRLLYDTGPFYSPLANGGERVIVPYLKARGITALDGVIVTHNDNDHSGGALSVLEEMRVGWVASSLSLTSPIVAASPEHRRCTAGQSWSWDGVQFEMLQPDRASYDNLSLKPNARSCTLKVTLGTQSMLLPGDIEAKQEAQLLESQPEKLRSTVLLAPHHGSGTSSTAPFLAVVRPEIALFQVGYRNRYRHPKQEVFERYGDLGIRRLRNDEAGAITLHFGAGLQFSEYRQEHARYWYGR